MRDQGKRRHFPYAHPTFGTKTRPKKESAWKRSVYFWWWAYLKRSAKYIKTCQNPRAGELKELYAQFGDVRGDDFKSWWNKNSRGVRLFAEPKADEVVRIVTSADDVAFDGRALLVSLPLNLPKRYLQRKVRDLLVKYHKGRRGHSVARSSRALFKVRGQPNAPALETGLMVYDFWKANPEMPLWKIGNELRLLPKDRVRESDPKYDRVNKKNVLAATVSRYLRRVKASIAATEQGQFP